eukprot:4901513-Amphidinium_carterae.2
MWQGRHGAYKVQQYAASRVQFRRLETHERCFHMLASLHSHEMRGEYTVMLAKTCQYLKAIEQSTQQNGAWRASWLLTGLPDPRPPPGSLQQGLSHAAELGLAASYLKEWKILEETAKKESEGSAQQGGGNNNSGGGNSEHKRKGGGKGDHTN